MIQTSSRYATSGTGHRFDPVVVAYVAGHGRRQEGNQDSFWPRSTADIRRPVVDYLTAGRLYVVSDGVSLGLLPQEAGRLAAQITGETYYRLSEGCHLGHDPAEPLRQALLAAHQALLQASEQARKQQEQQKQEDKEGKEGSTSMQAACACLLILGDRVYTAHVGDCRAYLWRDGALHQLTRDHVDAAGQVSRLLGADLMPAQIEVGMLAATGLGPLQAGDRLLLCSDGIHRFVGNHTINQVLNRREGLASTADGLVAEVVERAYGHEDDIALILIGVDYDPRQLVEWERESARYRAARQWEEAIALAEQVAWWQPYFGGQQRPILRTLADLYVEAAVARMERDQVLALKLLENGARLGSAEAARWRDLATCYLEASRRWLVLRHQEGLLPEKEEVASELVAVGERAVALFGLTALATAREAARSLAQELQWVGREWDALTYAAWAARHPDNGSEQEAQALAEQVGARLRERQEDRLRQALQSWEAQHDQDEVSLALWQQLCRALLLASDSKVQKGELIQQVAAAQQALYSHLAKTVDPGELDARYERDMVALWGGTVPTLPQRPGARPIPAASGGGDKDTGTKPLTSAER